jgi:predicted phage terminase large subunit-like protein
MRELTPEDIRQLKASAEVRFFEFVKSAWPTVVPGEPFQSNWHVEAICDHLQALAMGQITNLLINMPPRHGKSILCCVMYPAWLWIVDPAYRMIYASYSQTFAMRDSRETHRLIQSEWYQRNWAARYALTEDADAQVRFENSRKGFRIATSPGGLGTGEGGDLIVVDDPHKADEVSSDVQRLIPIDWWNVTMQTRTGRYGRTKRLVVMQRLHENDLSGDILARGGYEHLCLPQEFEGAHPFKNTWSGWRGDPRTQEGELLWPDRFPRERIEAEQKPPRMTSVVYAGQYQQRPAPAEGGMFLRKWFKFYKTLPDEAPTGACLSCDFTFKDQEDSDFVAITAWKRYGRTRDTSTFYLLPYMVHDRMGFSSSKMALRTLKARYPDIPMVVVESTANGPAILDDVKSIIPTMVPWPPKGRKLDSKEARAAVMQPYAEAGSIYLPDPSIAPWIEEWIYEHLVFPNGTNDDWVDSASQAVIYLLERVGKDFHISWHISKKYTGDRGETYRDPREGEAVINIPPVSERGDLKKARPMKPARIVP